MSDGRFKLARIRLSQIYPMGLEYIRSRRGAMLLEPDGGRTNPVGQIYLTWGQICPTRTACHGFGTQRGPNISGSSDISDLGSNMSN
jgi:hypothetical protein